MLFTVLQRLLVYGRKRSQLRSRVVCISTSLLVGLGFSLYVNTDCLLNPRQIMLSRFLHFNTEVVQPRSIPLNPMACKDEHDQCFQVVLEQNKCMEHQVPSGAAWPRKWGGGRPGVWALEAPQNNLPPSFHAHPVP